VVVRIVIGGAVTLLAFALAGWRLGWLARLIRAGSPAPGRIRGAPRRLGAELIEVIGQRKLLRRPQSGIPHALTFWGFIILLVTIVEAYGDVFYDKRFAIPVVGHSAALGFVEDLFMLVVLAALVCFGVIRVTDAPARRGRRSRFYGSHTGAAWFVLAMISAVMITLLGYRAAQVNTGDFPYGSWAFASRGLGRLLHPLGLAANGVIETTLLLANVAAIMAFLVFVTYSKHLHIFLAPLNVAFSRRPRALGPLAAAADAAGASHIEQLSWKQLLDLVTCTECGRCQAACPAWQAGQPLSPKLLVMDLRDHLLDSAPRLLGSAEQAPDRSGAPAAGPALVPGVIQPQVVWSCTTCGACVEQCPVDIEHVDTIVDLRRALVDEGRMEPSLQEALQNIAQQGNSFGKSARMRARWTRGLDFAIKDARKEPVKYLWFVGDYASFDDRLQASSRALARILHGARVDFGLLYEAERNAGNDVRRVGEEGLFELLAEQNIQTLRAAQFEEIFTTDPHSLNTLRNEYPERGASYQVWHYTELLAHLLETGAIPVRPLGYKVTYHDPCYLARHNRVVDAPRRILAALGCELVEMPRNKTNTFCCGAGGGRIWMDDSGLTERPSENRIKEAMQLDVSQFIVACPKDVTMYSDAAKTTGNDDRLAVRDITLLVEEALVRPAAADAPEELTV
jgi:Fe-S oxidoreductase